MGSLLHKLWDETLAGPTPDSGLGKLRKYNSFPATAPPLEPAVAPPLVNKVSPTPSIPVPRSNNPYRDLTVSIDSPPSPSCSTAPNSPFSPNTPGGNFKRLTRRKSSAAAVAKSPTGYDWIVLSALDR